MSILLFIVTGILAFALMCRPIHEGIERKVNIPPEGLMIGAGITSLLLTTAL